MKTSFHHGNLKEACIETGLEIIKNDGIDKLSLRDVARKLDVSHGAPYRHFKNKDELIAAISEKGFEIFGRTLISAIEVDQEDPYKRLATAGHAYLEFALEKPEYYRLISTNVLSDVTKYPGVMGKALETYQFMQKILTDYDARGILKIDNILTATVYIISTIHGFCSLVIEGRFEILSLSKEAYHEQLENLLQLCWKALKDD